jgi:GntR family phosphonate transport system transcriptional regulator
MARAVRKAREEGALGGAGPAPVPRWSEIARDLAASIERGQYPDGTSLPSAAAVADRYGVHRHTARQAFRHLQDLGLVLVERGRGTIVTGRRLPYRIGRRVSLRANLGAAGLAVDSEIVECRQRPADAAIAGPLRLPPGAAIWEFRTLNRAAGVPVSTGIHHLCVDRFADLDRRLVAARGSFTAAFAAYGIRDYVRLSTRLAGRQPNAREKRLLGLSRGTPVIQSTGLDGLSDGTPLHAVETAFAADRVEFVVTFEPDEDASGRG